MRSLLLLSALTLLYPPGARALTETESTCQRAASKQLYGFAFKKIRCLVACDRKAVKGKVPPADCLPPFAGKTRACVDGAEAKAATAAKPCLLACPACYAGGDCAAHAVQTTALVEAAIDAVIPLVRCDDGASPDGLSAGEAKVRQKIALVVGVMTNGYGRCLNACRKLEAKGTTPPGSCDAGAETHAKTLACLIKVTLKAATFIEDPALDAPECLTPDLTFTLPLALERIYEFDDVLFCGSPSGAFVGE